MKRVKRMTDAQRLARIAEIIEAADQRGGRLTQFELSEIYELTVMALVRRDAAVRGDDRGTG